MKTHVVKIVKQIPREENTSGTSAHGDNQSIISAGILSHPVILTLGLQPGPHDKHVSLRAYESRLHFTHTQQHWSWKFRIDPAGQGSLHTDFGSPPCHLSD